MTFWAKKAVSSITTATTAGMWIHWMEPPISRMDFLCFAFHWGWNLSSGWSRAWFTIPPETNYLPLSREVGLISIGNAFRFPRLGIWQNLCWLLVFPVTNGIRIQTSFFITRSHCVVTE